MLHNLLRNLFRPASSHRGQTEHRACSFRPVVETLEDRCVPAGNITSSSFVFNGTDISLVGDAAANDLQITSGENAGEVVVSGLNGTTIDGAESKTFSGINGLRIDLREGSDRVLVSDLTLTNETRSALSIYGGLGHDVIKVTNTSLSSAGSTGISADGGPGHDVIEVTNTALSSVANGGNVSAGLFVRNSSEGGDSIRVADSIITAGGLTSGYSIAELEVYEGNGADISITNVTLNSNAQGNADNHSWMRIRPGGGSQVELVGNTLTSLGGSGFEVETKLGIQSRGRSSVTFQDNTITSNGYVWLFGGRDTPNSIVVVGNIMPATGVSITTGHVHDSIVVVGNSARIFFIGTGDGSDTVELRDNDFDQAVLYGGDGVDTLILGDNTGTFSVLTGFERIYEDVLTFLLNLEEQNDQVRRT